jgi:hypothetical protein
MVLDKNDYQSDAIVNLYRAAFYLARGSEVAGWQFFRKAKEKLGRVLDISPQKLKSHQEARFWAEKILDQYLKFKHSQ